MTATADMRSDAEQALRQLRNINRRLTRMQADLARGKDVASGSSVRSRT
jgi:hypothetical protein